MKYRFRALQLIIKPKPQHPRVLPGVFAGAGEVFGGNGSSLAR
jgi:hypothetical protein